jgi:hypothetical protein
MQDDILTLVKAVKRNGDQAVELLGQAEGWRGLQIDTALESLNLSERVEELREELAEVRRQRARMYAKLEYLELNDHTEKCLQGEPHKCICYKDLLDTI